MVKFLLNLPDGDLEELRRLSLATGVPVSQHIRVAIGNYLHSGSISCSLFVSGSMVSGSLIAIRVGG